MKYDYYYKRLETFWSRWKHWLKPLLISVAIVAFFDAMYRRGNRKPANFRERVEQHLSKWTGAHDQLETYVKASMKNPNSYEHVSTKYILPDDTTALFAIYITTFRGQNALGATVTQTVRAKCNIETGSIETVLPQ